MGIEKVVPTYTDLEVFLQLLPRSSTGERMNPYTSLWTGVTPGDGPQEFHLVLLDNGRTDVLADEVGRAALHCIRCSACLNVCPVYERVGGHAYGSVYPGPIGAILTPQLTKSSGGLSGHHDPNASLPYASTLCGACYEVCPVKIDIPSILVELRAREVDADRGRPTGWGAAMKAASFVMSDARRFELAEKAAGSDAWSPGRRAGSRPSRRPRPRGPARATSRRPRSRPSATGGATARPTSPAPREARTGERARRRPRPRAHRARRVDGDGRPRGVGHRPARLPRARRARPGSPEVVDVLVDRLVDYRAHVHRAETSADVATVVADLLVDATSVVVPAGLDAAWLAALGAGTAVVRDARDDPRTPDELDRTDAVVTAARVAIGDTGTIVLDGEPDQGRRAITLVPDLHVCVVRTDQVVQSVPEAVRLLSEHPERPQTWISGPSATSDIELSASRACTAPHPARRPRPTEVELRSAEVEPRSAEVAPWS